MLSFLSVSYQKVFVTGITNFILKQKKKHTEQRESVCLIWVHSVNMMTSSNGNIFHVSGILCGNAPVTGEFPTQRPATRSFDVFFELRLNQQLSKQSRPRWFETPSRSLWRHCKDAEEDDLLYWALGSGGYLGNWCAPTVPLIVVLCFRICPYDRTWKPGIII